MLLRSFIIIIATTYTSSLLFANTMKKEKRALIYQVSDTVLNNSNQSVQAIVESNFLKESLNELMSKYNWQLVNQDQFGSENDQLFKYSFAEIDYAKDQRSPLVRVQKELDELALRHAILVGCKATESMSTKGYEKCAIYLYDAEKSKIIAESKKNFEIPIANPMNWSRYIIAQLWSGYKNIEQKELQKAMSSLSSNVSNKTISKDISKPRKYMLDIGLSVDVFKYDQNSSKNDNYSLSIFSYNKSNMPGFLVEYSKLDSGHHWGSYVGMDTNLLNSSKLNLSLMSLIGFRQEKAKGPLVNANKSSSSLNYGILSMSPSFKVKLMNNISLSFNMRGHYMLNKHLDFIKTLDQDLNEKKGFWLTSGVGVNLSI